MSNLVTSFRPNFWANIQASACLLAASYKDQSSCFCSNRFHIFLEHMRSEPSEIAWSSGAKASFMGTILLDTYFLKSIFEGESSVIDFR